MDIVEIVGGLGNQMFGYAFALSLASKRKKKVNLCLNSFSTYFAHNGYELGRIFNIRERSIGPFMYKLVWSKRIKLVSRYNQRECYAYDNTLFNDRSRRFFVYYIGYWQNEAYFTPIEEKIRSVFAFDEKKFSTQTQELSTRIKADKNSVSIHIRRGDYYLGDNTLIHGNLCPIDYYQKGIERIQASVPDATFYVFSDDPQWVAENFKLLESATYIHWNKGLDSWQDMALMSFCSHHIIANSSFSWWGAWLAKPFEEKIVIAPKKWLHTTDDNSIVPKRWVLL